ncbi:MAG: hypothetical protein OXG62_11615 [Nitrospinae bacterium]|nr:hypothetical protein [Nitrospinota bacterium]
MADQLTLRNADPLEKGALARILPGPGRWRRFLIAPPDACIRPSPVKYFSTAAFALAGVSRRRCRSAETSARPIRLTAIAPGSGGTCPSGTERFPAAASGLRCARTWTRMKRSAGAERVSSGSTGSSAGSSPCLMRSMTGAARFPASPVEAGGRTIPPFSVGVDSAFAVAGFGGDGACTEGSPAASGFQVAERVLTAETGEPLGRNAEPE